MVSPVETIFFTFEDPPIPPVEGVTTNKYLTALNNYLNGCAASVHSNLGNRTVGYLVLTDPPTMFSIAYAVLFVLSVNTGPTVTITDLPPTAVVIGMLTRTHDKYIRVFNEYYNVDEDCKKVLSSLIPRS